METHLIAGGCSNFLGHVLSRDGFWVRGEVETLFKPQSPHWLNMGPPARARSMDPMISRCFEAFANSTPW